MRTDSKSTVASRALSLFGFSLVLAGLVMTTARCDFGTVSGEPAKDTSEVKNGYASLTITNAFTQDPGDFEFNLYAPNATLVDNSTPVQKLGEVREGQSITVKIPKGTWKLGYVVESLAEPVRDLANTGVEWPKLAFADSGKYTLLMYTNEDESRNYLTHNIPEVR
jgi:hypothetical protein